MHKNATVAEWYKNHGKHDIYAKGKNVNLQSSNTRSALTPTTPPACAISSTTSMTAAEEDRARRKKAFEEQAKVRAIYEELVLKKPQPTVVQIGTVQDIARAIPANFTNAGKPVGIAPAAPKQEAETSRRRLITRSILLLSNRLPPTGADSFCDQSPLCSRDRFPGRGV